MEAMYRSLISEFIHTGLLGAPTDFPDLLRRLPGIWPGLIVEHLEELSQGGSHVAQMARRLSEDARLGERAAARSPFACAMPVEHPLDFEWRFADVAIERLWSEYEGVASQGPIIRHWGEESPVPAEVVLLGSPSLLWSAFKKGMASRCLLLDSNENMVRWFLSAGIPQAMHCVIGHASLPNLQANFVVLDPPWYSPHYMSFLWDARSVCCVGAKVAVSLPPIGTRPGLEIERAHLLHVVTQMGFQMVSLESAALPYKSPFFEANALRAAGLRGVPLDWRRGDLLILRVERQNAMPRPPAPSWIPWPEVQIAGTRWRIDTQKTFPLPNAVTKGGTATANQGDCVTLTSLVSGDVLPTVSSRVALRSSANVWTSGNRIFHCEQPHELFRALVGLQSRDFSSEPQKIDIGGYSDIVPDIHMKLITRIREIIAAEREEMRQLGYESWKTPV